MTNHSIPYKYPLVPVLSGFFFFGLCAYLTFIYAPTEIDYDPNIWVPIFYQKMIIYACVVLSLLMVVIALIGAIYRINNPQLLIFSDFSLQLPDSIFKSREITYSQITKIEERNDFWIKILVLHTEKRSHVVARRGITITKDNYDKAHSLLKSYLKSP